MARQIPLVDLRDLEGTGSERSRFVQTLGEGLEEFGFVNVTGHGIDPSLVHRAYALAEKLFALPLETKRKYETPHDGRQRGYTSYGTEHAKDQAHGDLKEFWHVGRELGDQHPLHLSGDVPPNQFPSELPAFRATFLELFDRIDGFGNRLLDAVGTYLGLPDTFFGEAVRDGNSVLRIINYPDLAGVPYVPGAVRAAQHEDINLITILPASTRPGLELLTRDGQWMAVEAPPGVMICDTGDMMQLLTGGRLPATTHRVVNPPESDGGRLSMPFFLHPHPDFVLRSMTGAGPTIKARDFLHQRLVEIGVA